jgi:hypothetical protein
MLSGCANTPASDNPPDLGADFENAKDSCAQSDNPANCMGAWLKDKATQPPQKTASRTFARFDIAEQTSISYVISPMMGYMQTTTFSQVMSVLNSGDNAYAASQLNSLLANYTDISLFFNSLSLQQKRQLWQATPPGRFNAILAQMTLSKRKAWCAYYLALGWNNLVPITTNGTTWQ